MVGALPLAVWRLELAANGARPGFRAKPGKTAFSLQSSHRLHPNTGPRHRRRQRQRTGAGLFIQPTSLITAEAAAAAAAVVTIKLLIVAIVIITTIIIINYIDSLTSLLD